MPVITEDLFIHSTDQGHGPPLILVHGLGASSKDWDEMLPRLVGAGYRVLTLDLPGHGESAKPDDTRQYALASVCDRFCRWVDGLDLNPAPVLVGHSLGGYLSLYYALEARGRKPRGVVLIAPFYSRNQLQPMLRLLHHRPGFGEKAMRYMPHAVLQVCMRLLPVHLHYRSERVLQQNLADYRRASPKIVHIPLTAPDLTPSLGDLQVKTLVIWGDRDMTLQPRYFRRLVNALPDVTEYHLRGGYHQPHVFQAGLVCEQILGFVEGLPEATGG